MFNNSPFHDEFSRQFATFWAARHPGSPAATLASNIVVAAAPSVPAPFTSPVAPNSTNPLVSHVAPNTTDPLFGSNNTPGSTLTPTTPMGVASASGPAYKPTGEPSVRTYAFKQGGLVGNGGVPIPPGQPIQGQGPMLGAAPVQDTGGPVNSNLMGSNIQSVASNPEVSGKIQKTLEYAIKSGQLTLQELNMAVQLAKTAMHDPSMWPQLRDFAIKQGLATDQDLPQQFDPGLVSVLAIIGQSVEDKLGGQATNTAPQGGAPVKAVVHEGEYVIPRDVVLHHGKKTFDKMVSQAREPPKEQVPASGQ